MGGGLFLPFWSLFESQVNGSIKFREKQISLLAASLPHFLYKTPLRLFRSSISYAYHTAILVIVQALFTKSQNLSECEYLFPTSYTLIKVSDHGRSRPPTTSFEVATQSHQLPTCSLCEILRAVRISNFKGHLTLHTTQISHNPFPSPSKNPPVMILHDQQADGQIIPYISSGSKVWKQPTGFESTQHWSGSGPRVRRKSRRSLCSYWNMSNGNDNLPSPKPRSRCSRVYPVQTTQIRQKDGLKQAVLSSNSIL